MRTLIITAFAVLAIAPVALADPAPDQSQPMHTPDQQNTANVGVAASAPLRDMNLMRDKIPPVLLAALADAYVRPGPPSCRVISAKVAELDAALGPDLDSTDNEMNAAYDSSRMSRSVVKGAAEMLLPFSGFVRTLSGAEAHDRLVLHAVIAGHVRRAYLKGLGEARGCPPPGTPRHGVVAAQPVVDSGPRKPQYPIH